jgi:23S rRNA pseudouridine1911/1915/1917 synthase
LIECRLATGRTHQIRVHLAWKGYPIVGDPTYSSNRRARARPLGPGVARAVAALGRQALHATLIGFTHPATAERLEFESALPSDINELQKELEGV